MAFTENINHFCVHISEYFILYKVGRLSVVSLWAARNFDSSTFGGYLLQANNLCPQSIIINVTLHFWLVKIP